MTASAQGIDVSSYQDRLTAAALKPYAFAFTKATDGPETLDPNFYVNWQMMKSVGIHRGTYHELWSSSSASPVEQADRFLDVVHAGGLEPGDMLAVVASDYQGVTDAEVKAFCDHVKAAAPRCIVLVYSDLSLLRRFPPAPATRCGSRGRRAVPRGRLPRGRPGVSGSGTRRTSTRRVRRDCGAASSVAGLDRLPDAAEAPR